MYYIKKEMEISASHRLELTYESKCKFLHGHNWHITVYCRAEKLNENGMVEDFGAIKESIHGFLDHGMLNELVDFNPTAENIAKWVTEQVVTCYKAEVHETDGNMAAYERKHTITEEGILKDFTTWLNEKQYFSAEKCQELLKTYLKEEHEKI